MENNEINEIVFKLTPPIFIKTKIQSYQAFCEKIKNQPIILLVKVLKLKPSLLNLTLPRQMHTEL
jgi:hypothetical protein